MTKTLKKLITEEILTAVEGSSQYKRKSVCAGKIQFGSRDVHYEVDGKFMSSKSLVEIDNALEELLTPNDKCYTSRRINGSWTIGLFNVLNGHQAYGQTGKGATKTEALINLYNLVDQKHLRIPNAS